MFPWNYGFHFGIASYIFLGAFYTVLVVVAATILNALRRAHRDLSKGRAEDIRWHSDFHELSAADRTCRHVLTGEFKSRECQRAFDCRECETHAKLAALHPPAAGAEDEIFGMSFPLDRLYHRGHTWAHPEPDGTVTGDQGGGVEQGHCPRQRTPAGGVGELGEGPMVLGQGQHLDHPGLPAAGVDQAHQDVHRRPRDVVAVAGR